MVSLYINFGYRDCHLNMHTQYQKVCIFLTVGYETVFYPLFRFRLRKDMISVPVLLNIFTVYLFTRGI
jgi:hypothetical protein